MHGCLLSTERLKETIEQPRGWSSRTGFLKPRSFSRLFVSCISRAWPLWTLDWTSGQLMVSQLGSDRCGQDYAAGTRTPRQPSQRTINSHITFTSRRGCLGGAAVRRRTRDRKVAGSTPGRGATNSTRSTQPSIPQVNRVPACMAGVRRGAFTCVGWQVTLCDPIWQVTSRSSEMGLPWRAISAFTFFYFKALSSYIMLYRDWYIVSWISELLISSGRRKCRSLRTILSRGLWSRTVHHFVV